MVVKRLPQTCNALSALTSQKTEEQTVAEFKVALCSYDETMKAQGRSAADDDQVLCSVNGSRERGCEFTETTHDVLQLWKSGTQGCRFS